VGDELGSDCTRLLPQILLGRTEEDHKNISQGTLGLTLPLTEISTRNLPGGKGQPAGKADNLTAICEPIVLENVGASTSHNPLGLHGLLQGQFYIFSLHVMHYHDLSRMYQYPLIASSTT
jgi:hypothetical protein